METAIKHGKPTIEPDAREFVVDPKASVHMPSRKDQNSAELETVRVSRTSFTKSHCGQGRGANE